VSHPGTTESPLRVAVIGSGPAGFYAADALLKRKELTVQVDVFDRLPTPWGLVRAGVAPDHPNIKSVSRAFEKIAAHPEFRFYGNVDVGGAVPVAELERRYHALVYAVGAETDRRLGIAGEDLPGSWAATEFVAWYNGHPDFVGLEFDLASERAVVIGAGNVALDVARMLALTHEELAVTDVADYALEALRESRVREIVVCGRRGPAQAAFTPPELKELGDLADADVLVDPADVELDPESARYLDEEAGAIGRRNVDVLREFAARPPRGLARRVVLRFLVSPVEIRGDGRVEEIELVRNALVAGEDGSLRAVATGEHERVPCGLVFRSIGYKGVPLAGAPFDERSGVIPNDGGRVLEPQSGLPLRGHYCAGWIKRGPTGVIGTNKKDATETVELLLGDLADGRLLEPGEPSREALEALLRERAPEHVTYAGWEAIDRIERGRGEEQGRPRVKLCTREELLAAAREIPAAPRRGA
jgi:ferredoxin--NADP+ reductase